MRTKTKIWFIVAAFLVIIGCVMFGGVMMKLKWDFSKLSTSKYVTNTYEIEEEFQKICVQADTADITFRKAEDGICKVVCVEHESEKHETEVKDGTLSIQLQDERKWFEHIGINVGTSKITVFLPQGFMFSSVDVLTSTGDIVMKKIETGRLNLSVSTGKITVESVKCEGDVKLKVTTGNSFLTDVQCKNLSTTGNTGKITMKSVVAEEQIDIKRSTGDVSFEKVDASDIVVKVSTGDVKGSLLSEKVFVTKMSTECVYLPKTINGGTCKIETSTGDIKISIEKE